jgi:lipid-A-disaccharide synthase-like uncharacterized protein
MSADAERKRVKWEPGALMVLVLGLGFWIAFGPSSRPAFAFRPNAITHDIRVVDTRGALEAVREPSGEYTFRVLYRDQSPSPLMSRQQAEVNYGAQTIAAMVDSRRNWLYRTLNVTSPVSMIWVGIGLIGQLAFSGRMLLQWIVSEKERKSVIGESFWWFSLFGGLTLFSYCVWRQDPVTMIGQAFGIVVYARNLRLIYKTKHRVLHSSGTNTEAKADDNAQLVDRIDDEQRMVDRPQERPLDPRPAHRNG